MISPSVTPKRVVIGFVSDDEKQLRGAPVGLTQDRDGALIIADDAGNTVWRVTKSGTGRVAGSGAQSLDHQLLRRVGGVWPSVEASVGRDWRGSVQRELSASHAFAT